MAEKSFFEEETALKIEKINTAVTNKSGNLIDMLKEFNINGKVIVHCVNELKFGYRTGDEFVFADGEQLDEKYVLQLCIFNQNEELLLQKNGDVFQARYIIDTAGDDGNKEYREYVDSCSPLFGDRDTAAKLPQGFVRLVESGRKIYMTIPADKTAKNYLLKTRSYITSDAKTGQAGYSFWRFVDIEAR